jgi:hypothetical protein
MTDLAEAIMRPEETKKGTFLRFNFPQLPDSRGRSYYFFTIAIKIIAKAIKAIRMSTVE